MNRIFPDPAVARLADAAARGDRRQVAELAPGVDLAATGDDGVTLLQWALFNKSADGLEALLEAGANPNQPGLDGDTVVHLAAMANDDAYLKILLAKGADPNAPQAETGAMPLRSAMMGERVEQFRALLAAGADPNRADRMGNTPLHVAGQINEPARALDLLQAGADPMAKNLQGATFQRYLFMTRVDLLNAETRKDREAVQAWLTEHGIALETAR
ncbi:MAG: ankyrin repeat domain-containing protein [Lysobacter sp.]|nr:ankyrin repeat domain-containing protein [Lysobacter sp.]